eukprot:scaffold56869_cov60-Phaeocystis_antarctica.AAC.2
MTSDCFARRQRNPTTKGKPRVPQGEFLADHRGDRARMPIAKRLALPIQTAAGRQTAQRQRGRLWRPATG